MPWGLAPELPAKSIRISPGAVIGAGRELADRGAGRRLRAPDDFIPQRVDVLEAMTRAKGDQPLGPDAGAGDLGGQIAEDGIRGAHVVADDVVQGLVGPALLVELGDRDPEPLFVNVARAGADAVAPDVGVVNGRAQIGDDPPLVEDRRKHRDVEEVPGRDPGIVDDQHVARTQLRGRKLQQDIAARRRQAVDVPGGAGHGLGDHAALGVEHAVREIAGLAYDRAEGDALQGACLFADDADQVAPQDFELDAVHDPLSPHTKGP